MLEEGFCVDLCFTLHRLYLLKGFAFHRSFVSLYIVVYKESRRADDAYSFKCATGLPTLLYGIAHGILRTDFSYFLLLFFFRPNAARFAPLPPLQKKKKRWRHLSFSSILALVAVTADHRAAAPLPALLYSRAPSSTTLAGEPPPK